MSNIRRYDAGGYHWLGAKINGRIFLIHKVGRIGDCMRFQ